MAGTVFIEAVDTWLKDKGFHAHMSREGTLDGHALRESLAAVKMSGCATHGSCVSTYAQAVLDQIKVIPGWTKEQARSVLEAAGLDPDDFKL